VVDGSVQGFAHDRFAPVHAAFEGNLTTGADVGASFCATVDGETVVDLWGGYADEARTRPWHRDTIVNVYSTTKTMTALTALLLADRGELDFDAPVARYWPEFAANGKERVTVSTPFRGALTELQANAANPRVDPLVTRTRGWRGAEIPAGGGPATPVRWPRSRPSSPTVSASCRRRAAARRWSRRSRGRT
jgi:hypothetical protein